MVALPTFFGALLSSPALQADPIGSWGGASADVYASGLTSSQHGLDAEANAWGSTPISYTSALVDYRPDAFNVQSASHAGAKAIGDRDALLSVQASQSIGNPGTRPSGAHSAVAPGATAEASWTGDRIHIQPGENGAMPDHVRLGVVLNVPTSWRISDPDISTGMVDFQAGNKQIQLNPYRVGGSDLSSWLIQQGFDSAETIHAPGSPNGFPLGYKARTFIDLAIDDKGWSDPFDLSLKLSLNLLMVSNRTVANFGTNFTLSLDDLTLGDGTSVVDAGDSATFESGLAWPQPVPEPASIAAWIALVGSAGWSTRKRARRSVACDMMTI